MAINAECHRLNYGSKFCRKWDWNTTNCKVDADSTGVEQYCFESWCYVDKNKCTELSDERVHVSDYFPTARELYYSYTTCNSTESSWLKSDQDYENSNVLGGEALLAAVPMGALWPYIFKLDDSGNVLPHDKYYNQSTPYEGSNIDYVKDLESLSRGDLHVNFTHTSRGSMKQHASSFTAAVQDVGNGLVDFAVGNFWVTSERLQITTFTIPFAMEQIVLVVPKPGKPCLKDAASKVFEPFSHGMWLLIIAVIFIAALLGVWITDRDKLMRARYGKSYSRLESGEVKRNRGVFLRLLLDAVLEKGIFLCSAGIEQDSAASLPHKLLLVGFGFFILIVVSAYVADLAAYLATAKTNSVTTIEEAINQDYSICAPAALKEELIFKWKRADFNFDAIPSFEDVENLTKSLTDALRSKCKVLVIGEELLLDTEIVQALCESDLLVTDSVLLKIPLAFPVRPQINNGLSYWMHHGQTLKGVSWESARTKVTAETVYKCNLNLSDYESSGDYGLSAINLFIPVVVFLGCAFVAVVLHSFRDANKYFDLPIGRSSGLALITEEEREELTGTANLHCSDLQETLTLSLPSAP